VIKKIVQREEEHPRTPSATFICCCKLLSAVPSLYRRPEVFEVLQDSCPEGGAAREACAVAIHHSRCVDANLSSLEAFGKPLRCPGIMESLTYQFFAAKSLLQPNTL